MINQLSGIPRLPDDAQIARSVETKCDRFYRLPKIIETFVERANGGELPSGFIARPWTIARLVSIFDAQNECVKKISYDWIEDDIAHELDALKTL